MPDIYLRSNVGYAPSDVLVYPNAPRVVTQVRSGRVTVLDRRPPQPVYRDRGALRYRVSMFGTARGVRAAGSSTVEVSVAVRTSDWAHLTVPFPLLDLLLEDWDV